jgi:Tol biopolymer transport system component
MACLSHQQMLEFVQRRLDETATHAAEIHLDDCDLCRQTFVALLPTTPVAGVQPSRPPGTIGRYVLLEPIGAGGMGVVYAARDPHLGRTVALKLLRPDATPGAPGDPRARMAREARAMARLSHPHVVPVFDVGTHEDQIYVVMEMVEGGTLRQWLERAPHGWREVLALLLEAGEGLAAAHRKGLVHRDFKPDNVLIGADGRARVTDFGLARLASGDDSLTPGAMAALTPDLIAAAPTGVGTVVGTPAYIAPEVTRGCAADRRSDVFSFCVSAYEALYGELPFPGATLLAIASAVERGEVRGPPPGSAVPMGLRDALLRGLRANPEERPADMEGLLAALGRTLHRRRTAWRAAAVLCAAAAAVAAALLIAGRSTRGEREPPRLRKLTDSGRDRSPATSADGRRLVFTSEREGGARIWLKDLDGGLEQPLTAGPDDRARLSPDGTRLLYVRSGSALFVRPVDRDEPRLVLDGVVDAEFSPGGDRVVFVRVDRAGAESIATASADGGGARDLVHAAAGAGHLDSPRWSPDGLLIAARQAAASTGLRDSILLVDADGSRPRKVDPPGLPGRISNLAFAAKGRALLYAESESLTSTRTQVSSRMVRLDLSTMQAETLFWIPARVEGLATAARGAIVFDSFSSVENLREVGVDGASTDARWILRGHSSDRQPVYSPDGEWLAFSSDRGGNLDLWEVSLRTNALRQLTADAADDWDPAFTRDGKVLLWSSNRSGAFEIWTAAADGSSARQLTHDGVDAENPTATADGQWIIYGSANPGKAGLWKIRPDGRDATRLVPGTIVWPEVSPDGRFVAYRSGAYDWPAGGAHLVSMRIARVADGEVLPFEVRLHDGLSAGRSRWMPDGRAIAFIGADESGLNGVFVQDFDPASDTTATRRRLAAFDSAAITESFSIDPSARRVAVGATEVVSSLMLAERAAAK